MSKKDIPTQSIDLNFFSNYISYEETLKALQIKKPTLQEHIREGKKFSEPGDTIILPNRKRVFLIEAVKREIANVLKENGVRNL